jgi:meiotically up-regulated gene 157 (Mug157) protein
VISLPCGFDTRPTRCSHSAHSLKRPQTSLPRSSAGSSICKPVYHLETILQRFPATARIQPSNKANGAPYFVTPSYDHKVVFSCNFKLDSIAAFLQTSYDYQNATGDANFFSKFQWIAAVQSLLAVSTDMMAPSYNIDGSPLQSPYTFFVQTTTSAGTLWDGGLGNPVNRTGLICSRFRPSDDLGLF